MWAVILPTWEVPSPKLQLNVYGETPPVAMVVKVIGTPISVGDGLADIVTARSTTRVTEWVDVTFKLSVAVTVATNVPAAA